MLVDGRFVPVTPWGTSTESGANIRRDGGGIVLDCGKGADDIAVRNLGCGMYGVSINGKEHVFTRAEMERLTINAGKGNDRITIGPGVDVPVKVNGGKGADQITNYANGAELNGGKGSDVIHNFGSGTSIDGGKGHDEINSLGNFNNIRGSKGNDRVQAFGSGNTIDGGKGHDDIFAYGFGNAAEGGRGLDHVHNQTPVVSPFGWCRLGVPDMGSAYLAGYAAGVRDGVHASAHAFGAAAWGDVAAFGPGAWALNMTASILGKI